MDGLPRNEALFWTEVACFWLLTAYNPSDAREVFRVFCEANDTRDQVR